MVQTNIAWQQFYNQIRKKPFISFALVIINIVVYVLCAITGDLLYNKGGVGIRVILETGEIYRIITSMFLHADLNHIFGNMILLIALGDTLEKTIGHVKFLVIYFLSGIGGNICSMMLEIVSQEYTYSIGASGAIYGMLGVLLGAVILKKSTGFHIEPIRVILVIGYSLYMGFKSPEVNNAAHIGGLICGFVLYYIVFLFEKMHFTKKTSGGLYEG